MSGDGISEMGANQRAITAGRLSRTPQAASSDLDRHYSDVIFDGCSCPGGTTGSYWPGPED